MHDNAGKKEKECHKHFLFLLSLDFISFMYVDIEGNQKTHSRLLIAESCHDVITQASGEKKKHSCIQGCFLFLLGALCGKKQNRCENEAYIYNIVLYLWLCYS